MRFLICWTVLTIYFGSITALPLFWNTGGGITEGEGIETVLSISNPVPEVLLPRDTSNSDTISPFISRFDELTELGNNNKTICPFEVVTKIKEQEHKFGNVIKVQYTEIVCAGGCTDCAEGRSCKQLVSSLEISISNTVARKHTHKDWWFPETMFITDVGIGCACTPDETGVLGNDYWQIIRNSVQKFIYYVKICIYHRLRYVIVTQRPRIT